MTLLEQFKDLHFKLVHTPEGKLTQGTSIKIRSRNRCDSTVVKRLMSSLKGRTVTKDDTKDEYSQMTFFDPERYERREKSETPSSQGTQEWRVCLDSS